MTMFHVVKCVILQVHRVYIHNQKSIISKALYSKNKIGGESDLEITIGGESNFSLDGRVNEL
jgi:hypothetical protein